MSLSNDKISRIYSQLDDTKIAVKESIDLVIERGEKLEVLETKAEYLSENASLFKTKATGLKRFMCCKNAKYTAITVSIIVVILFIIIMIIVGQTGGFSS
jgi:t-SNARE complex subunit (syntaxin)